MLTGEVPRARRYQVAFAIQYRPRKKHRWHCGVTRNVSASGVLFGEAAGDRQLHLDEAVEMELTIPSEVQGGVVTRIFCAGRVARIVESASAGQPRTIAATIARYRLRRP